MRVIDAHPAKLIYINSRLEEIMDLGTDPVLSCDLGLLLSSPENNGLSIERLGQRRPLTSGQPLIV